MPSANTGADALPPKIASNNTYELVLPNEEQHGTPTAHWPRQPSTLRKSFIARVLDLLPFVALLLAPIAFLVLAGCILVLRGQSEFSWGDKVIVLMGVASTLWPIAFAAVLGPLLRTVALYKAERGVTIRALEVLSGSQTLVSTLKACVNYRSFGLWSLLLVILWSLSPAGGQAVLRAMTVEQHVIKYTYPLMYHPTEDISIPFLTDMWGSASGQSALAGIVRMTMGAAISAPNAAAILVNGTDANLEHGLRQLGGAAKVIAAARTDVWGNVRMPYLEKLPGYNAEEPYAWVGVPTNEITVFESLVGVPVRGIPDNLVGNASFTVSAAYATLKCAEWQNTSLWLREYYGDYDESVLNTTTTFPISAIWEPAQYNVFWHFHSEAQDFPDREGAATTGDLLVGTIHNLTTCAINTTHVDAEVECVRSIADREVSCSATRARHSSNFPITTREAKFDSNVTGVASNNLMSAIPGILPAMHAMSLTPLEAWLADPMTGGVEDAKTGGMGITDQYTSLPPSVFDARLTVIFNTILRASYRTDIVLGKDGTDPANYTFDAEAAYPDRFSNTTGQWLMFSHPVYRVHFGWLVLYLLSIAVLFVCAVATIVLRMRLRAPDILDSVSAFARDSQYVRVPPGGSTLDGIQMARALGSKRIRIGDIRPDDEVGQIAFAEADMVRARILRKDRLYM